MGDDVTTTVAADHEVDPGLLLAARAICALAFGDRFTDDDWDHAAGGLRFLLYDGGLLVGHAAVVPRDLEVGDRRVRVGYVEAVAVLPEAQGRGLGSRLMRAVAAALERDTVELGVLSTGRRAFYERLGWQPWRGPSFVRRADGIVRTPEEDDGLLVLVLPSTPDLDLTSSLTCDARSGDDW